MNIVYLKSCYTFITMNKYFKTSKVFSSFYKVLGEFRYCIDHIIKTCLTLKNEPISFKRGLLIIFEFIFCAFFLLKFFNCFVFFQFETVEDHTMNGYTFYRKI